MTEAHVAVNEGTEEQPYLLAAMDNGNPANLQAGAPCV